MVMNQCLSEKKQNTKLYVHYCCNYLKMYVPMDKALKSHERNNKH
jgi:pyruvate formate-lyase activating enzyme-like uncharacterized protein